MSGADSAREDVSGAEEDAHERWRPVRHPVKIAIIAVVIIAVVIIALFGSKKLPH
jgi:hypothetical protein